MSTYDEMLAMYQSGSSIATPNAEQEVMQQITLAGLNRGGFFDHAAFYGGTSKELDIWSNDYFLQLADMIRFQ